MQTQDILFAAFVASMNIPVKKLAEDTFEFDLEEGNPYSILYEAPEGYNANIHKLGLKLEELSIMDIYVAPAPEEAQN